MKNSILLTLLLSISACDSATETKKNMTHRNYQGDILILDKKNNVFYLKDKPEIYYLNGFYYYLDLKQRSWMRCSELHTKCISYSKEKLPFKLSK